MLQKKVLIFAQDQGGTRFVLPVLKAIIKTEIVKKLNIIVHPQSDPLFHSEGIPYIPLMNAIGAPPISESVWSNFICQHEIGGVFCTTSSPYLDLSNCNLILSAKDSGIPVMGIMDHWKGYDRFIKSGRPDYLPDRICCIDSFCKEELKKLGISENSIHSVGHPGLEKICSKNRRMPKPKGKIHVLLVSQPITTDRSFKSIFFYQAGEDRLIDKIVRLINRCFSVKGQDVQISIRPHPKERAMEKWPENITIDDNSNWEKAIKANDIFIGIDSMALIEAHLAGKFCITLDFPELRCFTEPCVPFSYSKQVYTFTDFHEAINSALRLPWDKIEDELICRRILKDSMKRTLEIVEPFLRGKSILHMTKTENNA